MAFPVEEGLKLTKPNCPIVQTASFYGLSSRRRIETENSPESRLSLRRVFMAFPVEEGLKPPSICNTREHKSKVFMAFPVEEGLKQAAGGGVKG